MPVPPVFEQVSSFSAIITFFFSFKHSEQEVQVSSTWEWTQYALAHTLRTVLNP